MGVKGLLPQLKSIQEPMTLERYRGKRLAIDSYAWLHRSSLSCAWELAQDLETTKYISFFKKRIMMLRHFEIEPYFVFDGDNFSSKSDTELEREQKRLKNKEKGLELLRNGDKKGAFEFFSKSVDITPAMAKAVIEYLKEEKIKYIVAPYEADPQMVYLEKLGLVDGIISEDSDLLVFGAQHLLTKLNDTAQFVDIRRENFKNCKEVPIGLIDDSQLIMVACLSGCDYTSGVPGVGIVTAFKLVKRLGTMDKCLMSLRLEGKSNVPQGFQLEYKKADLSFRFQRVFNPITNEISTLNEVPQLMKSDEELLPECIGPLHDNDIHFKVAMAELDPISKDTLLSREVSIKSQSFNVIQTPIKPVPVQERVAKRSYSTPVIKTNNKKSIDSFFKSVLTSQKKTNTETPVARSSTVPSITNDHRVLTPKSLSPTSKRRKMFNTPLINPTEIPSSSKFFSSKKPALITKGTTTNILNSPESSSPELQPTKEIPILGNNSILPDNIDELSVIEKPNTSNLEFKLKSLSNVNSSDFELTDPDDDDEEQSGADNSIGKIREHDLFGKKEQINDKLREEIPSNTHVSNHAEITKGLYKKFGFNSSSSSQFTTSGRENSSRSKPLKSIQHNGKIRSNTSTLKTKRGITRNFTLDSFIYRGP
ncbi:Exonuclease 1 [Wickerhamomyces ciferrii]|uniref:Exonuclease 1 n=1 Tax=Wickerhamomyces ciferrii (strain ATCC 14091 / BCRC 22168 / CBS 111 / JCM 3599 / NBRC 0793 / NRRL Y-1031 F-60-10) TaxID=1206466 RepID=K0KRP1_WICCF|nr:Exonuclease 1 [Wickerhamomyces ciferrii]CCH43989.1 Exonuclease 1 [Wickerhamomyces ciferrii]